RPRLYTRPGRRSVLGVFQAAGRAVRALLLGEQAALDEVTRGQVQLGDVGVVPVELEAVVLALLEGRDGGLLAEQLGAALDQLGEAAPGARVLGAPAAQAQDLVA